MRVRYAIVVLLIAACCIGGWFFISHERRNTTLQASQPDKVTQPTALHETADGDTYPHANHSNSFPVISDVSCATQSLTASLSVLFTQQVSQEVSQQTTHCLINTLRVTATHKIYAELLTHDTFFQWLSFSFVHQQALRADLQLSALLAAQNGFSFLAIVQTLELQHDVADFLTANNSSLRELNSAILSYLLANSPFELLDLLNAELSDDVNIPIVGLLLSAQHPFSLAELWPILIKVELDEERDNLLQRVVQQYLDKDEEGTMYYLSDFYQFSKGGGYGRKYQFPKAINTLMAWHLNQLNSLTPEDYDKDSSVVIKKVGELLKNDPQQLFQQMRQIESAELQHKVFASVIQSKAFFSLEKQQFLHTLTQQPPELAHLLARAYVLQYAYLEGEEYRAKVEGLQAFLRPVSLNTAENE